jgi:hypothetical protein
MKHGALPSILLFLAVASAHAENVLPPDAAPLSSDELRTQLIDKTLARGGHERIYFAPNGTLIGVYDNRTVEALGKGTWTIDGNEFCFAASWDGHGAARTEVQCRKFYKSGASIIVQQTKNTDGDAPSVYPLAGFRLFPGNEATEMYSKVRMILSR